jgi:pyruvate carboxylase
VYDHEIPGGQLSNLRQQAIALGLGQHFEAIEDTYAAANRMLGNVVKVTPSSKVVGDLALALVGRGVDPADFEADPGAYDVPDSVIGFLQGELGDPPGGWPEPFRTKALAGRSTSRPRDAELAPDDVAGLAADPRPTLNRLLFPGPTREFETSRETYSDLSVLPTAQFLHGLRPGEEVEVEIEPGKRLLFGVQSVSDVDDHGLRTVMCTLNGQLRPVLTRDESADVAVRTAEKADPSVAGQVAAPFAGVVSLSVDVGASVAAGDTVATIEAMKMEAAITAPVAGTVQRLAIAAQQQVEGGDLLVLIA